MTDVMGRLRSSIDEEGSVDGTVVGLHVAWESRGSFTKPYI